MCDVRQLLGNAAGCRLFFNERDSDVAIRVEWEGIKCHFPGHRLILCAMSEVFRTMLEADMLEKNSKVITIRDSTPLAVKQFLKYLYMGIVDFSGWPEAVNILKIAHKYNVQALINLTEAYLLSQVVFANACMLHELGRTYCLKLLKKQTHNFILDSAFIVSDTDGFFNLKQKTLENFLSNVTFNAENEGSVLTSLREWAVCECSRRCMALSRSNVLSAMEPFLKYIRWDLIPEEHRTFVPRILVDKYMEESVMSRKPFHVPATLQYHMCYVKFVVELGAFHQQKTLGHNGLPCLKFSVDNHTFLCGFRLVGLFRNAACYLSGPACLNLLREDNKMYVQFNLNSLPWTRGQVEGRDVWREMIAYLPYPIRLDPFSSYTLTMRSGHTNKIQSASWPRTRLDTEILNTHVGVVRFRACGSCYGITQLFILPAPPYRNICNNSHD